jgi:hypothetical protein
MRRTGIVKFGNMADGIAQSTSFKKNKERFFLQLDYSKTGVMQVELVLYYSAI